MGFGLLEADPVPVLRLVIGGVGVPETELGSVRGRPTLRGLSPGEVVPLIARGEGLGMGDVSILILGLVTWEEEVEGVAVWEVFMLDPEETLGLAPGEGLLLLAAAEPTLCCACCCC